MKRFYFVLMAVIVIFSLTMLIRGKDDEAPAEVSAETISAAEDIPKATYEKMSGPGGDTSFKSFMDYRKITNTSSKQYKFQQECWTDANGLRRKGSLYVVALGTGYASEIGDRFRVTLEDGSTIGVIVGDFKADADTDSTNRYTEMANGNKNVLEFIVDVSALPRTARRMGDISYIEGLSGDVEKIEERKESQ